MELEMFTLLALFGVALIAGFIDAIAGGGGLLTVPALLATGMPPALAERRTGGGRDDQLVGRRSW